MQRPEDDGANGFAPALTHAFKERLRPCLNALDGLRSQGLQREISLPAIAVVGDQSVGKSSVLEAISGIEFPRGLGIVTRCPLMLSMRGREDAGWTARIRYVSRSGQAKDKTLATSAAIGQAIRDAQDEMTSGTGEISEKLIELHIEGSDLPDLTLIDLPGIARFSIQNGGDIATQSKSLIMSYIRKPEVIIMVVIPCNVDVETVEAVSLAKEVDPDSTRTIGVLTCPDLVNPGSEMEVLSMMRNEKLKLLKGFVTVRCRTPQQLRENMTLQEATNAEEEFFRQHQYFRQLDEYQRGSKTLANKLSVDLYAAVKSHIPEMLNEIQAKREEYLRALNALGTGPPETDDEMNKLIVTMVEEFKKEFENAAKGTHRHETSRLYGPCRRHWETLANAIEQCAFPDSADTLMQRVKLEVENQRGLELPGFDNIFPVLERLVHKFLGQLEPHSKTFLLSVTQEVDQVLRNLSDRVFGSYPDLNRHIKQEAESIKSKMLGRSRKRIDAILEQEWCVFTQDRTFLSVLKGPSADIVHMRRPDPLIGALDDADPVDPTQSPAATSPDEASTRSAQRVLGSTKAYLRVAVRRLQDTIPMVIIQYMLHKMGTKVSHRLGLMLTDVQLLYPMLKAEDPEVGTRRRHLKLLLEKLGSAEQELAKI